MCERLKQAVLKLACLLPPVFGINHLESANAALFGLDTGVRHANMQRIMQRWIGPPAERSLGVQTGVRFHFLFRDGVYAPATMSPNSACRGAQLPRKQTCGLVKVYFYEQGSPETRRNAESECYVRLRCGCRWLRSGRTPSSSDTKRFVSVKGSAHCEN
jgi:hypothetical protein